MLIKFLIQIYALFIQQIVEIILFQHTLDLAFTACDQGPVAILYICVASLHLHSSHPYSVLLFPFCR
jgi:hypothetical protein